MSRIWTLVLFLCLATSTAAIAQDVLPLAAAIAHYPLHMDGVDATGNNGPVTLVNAPFTHNAVSCSGIFAGEPNGYLVSTPYLSALNFGSFAVAVKFQITSYPAPGMVRLPIIVCGDDTRYFGAELYEDGSLGLLYDNSNHAKSAQSVSKFAWHTLVLTYEAEDNVGRIYLDNTLVSSQYFLLVQSGDRNVSTTNFSESTAYEGLICEIAVYDSAFDPLPVREATWGGVKHQFRR